MASDDSEIQIVEVDDDDEEDDENELDIKEIIRIMNVSEEAVAALQETEEGLELLEASGLYIRRKIEDEKQYEEALYEYQEATQQVENECSEWV